MCGFKGAKYGGLRNVRPPIIDPPNRVESGKKKLLKSKKSRGCQGSFFVLSTLCVFWLSENLVLQIFLINLKQGKLIRNNFSAKS